jgi:pilus assembly protein Flp/PilA
MNQLKRLFKEEEGQAMTEYGLLVGLIAIALITVLATLGRSSLKFQLNLKPFDKQ